MAVVDKLPLGQAGELEADARGAQARLATASSCSACATSRTAPRTSGASGASRCARAIERYYDAILVYGPESTPDAIDCIGQLDSGCPIHHVGYVGTAIPDAGPADLEGGYLLVTAGGGFDGFRLLATFAEAVRLRPLELPRR